MTKIQNFYIGQTFQTPKQEFMEENHMGDDGVEVVVKIPLPLPWENYPPEAAVWCNQNNAMLQDNADGTFTIVAVPAPTPEELNAVRLYEINAALAELDVKSTRALRAVVSGMSTDADVQALKDNEVKAASLREERASLLALEK